MPVSVSFVGVEGRNARNNNKKKKRVKTRVVYVSVVGCRPCIVRVRCVCVQAVVTASHIAAKTEVEANDNALLRAAGTSRPSAESLVGTLFCFFAFLLCVFVASGSLTEWCEEQDRARYSWCTYTYGTDHQHSGGNEASGSDDGRRPLAEKSSVALHTASYVQTSGRPPRPATQHRRHPPSPPQPRRDEGEGGLHFFVRGGCGGTRAPLSCRPANG